MSKRWMTGAVITLVIAVLLLAAGGCGTSKPTSVVMATTTSVQDSGLLDALLPTFEKDFNHTTKVIAVGTGEAIAMGRRGDADVLLVHAKIDEELMVKEGYGLERVEIMYNDFIIVGPQADPAGIKGDQSASDAFKKIAAAGATFVSRGDNSGTNKKEFEIWKAAGVTPKGQPWYLETGQGMGETLTVTNEKQGYTLTDRATYEARKSGLTLVLLSEGDKMLLNPYSVIVINPEKFPNLTLNTKGAGDFCQFMTSKKGQDMIGAYKKNGVVLFHPDAKEETRGMGSYKE